MKDDEIMSMVSQRKSMYGINYRLPRDMDVYYLDKDDVDYKHNNQVLNINHLEKIRLKSKIEEVHQVRVIVRRARKVVVGLLESVNEEMKMCKFDLKTAE